MILSSRRFIAGSTVCLFLATVVSLFSFAAEQAPVAPDPNDPNFDFSIYYTGNVRGNLEPCG